MLQYKNVGLMMWTITQAFPSPRGTLLGLAPPNKAPSLPKLKYETV